MEFINRNEELLRQAVPGGYYILDSSITRFDIYIEDYTIFIDVYFELPYHRFKTKKVLKLHFIEVTEYDLSWDKNYSFFTIERYKFFRSEKGFYISFNPLEESHEVSDDDSDVIFCKEVEGYFI